MCWYLRKYSNNKTSNQKREYTNTNIRKKISSNTKMHTKVTKNNSINVPQPRNPTSLLNTYLSVIKTKRLLLVP